MATSGLNEELAALDAGEPSALQGGPQQTTPPAGDSMPATIPLNAGPNDGEGARELPAPPDLQAQLHAAYLRGVAHGSPMHSSLKEPIRAESGPRNFFSFTPRGGHRPSGAGSALIRPCHATCRRTPGSGPWRGGRTWGPGRR